MVGAPAVKNIASLVYSVVNLIYVCSLGFHITFYIMKSGFQAIYTMSELCYIEIPQSVKQIDQITTNRNTYKHLPKSLMLLITAKKKRRVSQFAIID